MHRKEEKNHVFKLLHGPQDTSVAFSTLPQPWVTLQISYLLACAMVSFSNGNTISLPPKALVKITLLLFISCLAIIVQSCISETSSNPLTDLWLKSINASCCCGYKQLTDYFRGGLSVAKLLEPQSKRIQGKSQKLKHMTRKLTSGCYSHVWNCDSTDLPNLTRKHQMAPWFIVPIIL